MRKLAVITNVTLDGVMQSPSGPDEDRRDGFEHGGWTQPYNDPVMAEEMGKRSSGTGALLFGRWTYESFASYWPDQPDDVPFAKVLNDSTKYVASRTLKEPLPWRTSTLLEGDAGGAVARLKEEPGPDLAVLGSGDLVQTLMKRNLVDEFVLSIFPLVLGSGRRLFRDGGSLASLELVDSLSTTTGVVIATYRTPGS
jgi:dihydrofolate reductase